MIVYSLLFYYSLGVGFLWFQYFRWYRKQLVSVYVSNIIVVVMVILVVVVVVPR